MLLNQDIVRVSLTPGVNYITCLLLERAQFWLHVACSAVICTTVLCSEVGYNQAEHVVFCVQNGFIFLC